MSQLQREREGAWSLLPSRCSGSLCQFSHASGPRFTNLTGSAGCSHFTRPPSTGVAAQLMMVVKTSGPSGNE